MGSAQSGAELSIWDSADSTAGHGIVISYSAIRLAAETERTKRTDCAAHALPRIAAICLNHGVSELWSADRHFMDFPPLKLRNPLIDPAD